MLSLKENVYETLKNGKPDAFVNEWEPFPQVWDPVFFFMNPVAPGQTAVNPLGTTLYWGENEPGAMPIVNEKTKVCPDVTRWREYVKAPDLDAIPFDWTQVQADAEKIRAQDKFVMVWNVTGVFESLHFLMGFEDTLANLLEEPEAMHELIAYITEFKKTQIRLIIDNLHPDVIMFHDDWGSKYNLFMRPTVWREFFKQPYKEIYGLMKKHGIITMHHADCYCQPIAPDMVEVGIDIWEGILPSNDIQQIKKDTGYKLTLMGGIDASIVDTPDWTEDVVRAEVARACRDYSEGGCFIPCLTYGGEGSIHPGVNDIIMDEIRKQNKIYFK
ncbi:MAG: uroporphyrinogen decarboxylase (URO-D) [Clostridiales bacterium]|nr:uroporphyrinogen decarboxylase (URO-D) [Clostridiales bacterium]